MDTNSLSQSLDSVNTAVSVAGEEEVRNLSVSYKNIGVQYHHQAPNGTNGNISNLPSKRVWCEWKNPGVSVQQIYECFLDVEISRADQKFTQVD